jgi:hypothetical protein
MSEADAEQSLLEDLDARQDQVLEALDELNLRVERLLADCLAGRGESAGLAVE